MNHSFRIASYNIRKALGTDRRRDPERIAAVIAALSVDVAVLQEADLRLGLRPAALPPSLIISHTGMIPLELARAPVSLGWHGIAILVRPSVRLVALHHLDLPGLEPRGAVIADLEMAGAAVRVVGLHLGLLRHSRRKQLSHLLQTLTTFPVCPTIIAGDFNEISVSVGLGRLDPQFTIHTPGRSFHARKPLVALDRFATNDRLLITEMGVMRTPMTALASDHLPIWATAQI